MWVLRLGHAVPPPLLSPSSPLPTHMPFTSPSCLPLSCLLACLPACPLPPPPPPGCPLTRLPPLLLQAEALDGDLPSVEEFLKSEGLACVPL